MTLVADPNDKTLWRAAAPIGTGAHALIVGISEYPYLSDGSAPPAERARENGGLGQLEVCALTAARIFDWLRTAGEIAGAPVASCRLLLSPRATERAEVDRLTGGNYGATNFTTMRDAIEAWAQDIHGGSGSADDNVALFFFTGHGVEHASSQAILASDVLNPRAVNSGAGRAFSVEALTRSVKTYGIDRGLFLIDACRDAPMVTRLLNLVGVEALTPSATPPAKRSVALICLNSTASGFKSYQAATDPGTIFGQAVLEALEGPPPSHLPYDTKSVPWRLIFSSLEAFVKKRVRELLAGKTVTKLQPVEPYGYPYDGEMLVATKPGGEGGLESFPGAAPDTEQTELESVQSQASALLKEFRILGPESFPARSPTEFAGGFRDFMVMHEVFGHESLTNPWLDSLVVLDLESGRPVPEGAVRLEAAKSKETDDEVTAWLDLSIMPSDAKGVWIGAGGLKGEDSYAVAIPQQETGAVPVRLDVSYRKRPEGLDDGSNGTLQSLSARVGEPGPDTAASWRVLWEAQRHEIFSNLGTAGKYIKRSEGMEDILRAKKESPVAAAIATGTLLRCGSLEYLHDWPRNLADWFPELADGPVLWAETLLQQIERDNPGARRPFDLPEHREARQYFQMLAERGAPLLSVTLGMAARQAAMWREGLASGLIDDDDAEDLVGACELVEQASLYQLSGGVFSRFVSASDTLQPTEVFGAPRPKLQAMEA